MRESGRRRLTPLLAAGAVAVLALGGCGEPQVDLDLPARSGVDPVADVAGILDDAVAERLADLRAATGHDVVVVTFETDRASLGEAQRAGELALEEWGADIALTAVALPGSFTETDPDARRRFFGIEADRFTVTRDLRGRIVDEAVPSHAADNDWTAAFVAAAEVLEAELTGER